VESRRQECAKKERWKKRSMERWVIYMTGRRVEADERRRDGKGVVLTKIATKAGSQEGNGEGAS